MTKLMDDPIATVESITNYYWVIAPNPEFSIHSTSSIGSYKTRPESIIGVVDSNLVRENAQEVRP